MRPAKALLGTKVARIQKMTIGFGCKILTRPVATSYQIRESCSEKIRHSSITRYLKFSVSSFHAAGLWVELEEKVPQLQPLYFNSQMLYLTLSLMARNLMFDPQYKNNYSSWIIICFSRGVNCFILTRIILATESVFNYFFNAIV